MVDSDKFLYHRSVRSIDMLQGVITSILLHSILLIGSKYWYKALMREPNQEITQETPIEVVEVPANKTDVPPQTSFRATKNSIAGGKALPERPVSVMKSANPTEYKAYDKRSSNLTASSPAEVFQTRQQQKTESPISRQQPQFKSRKTVSASAREAQVPSKKIAVAPMTTPLPVPLHQTVPNPKPIPSARTTTVQAPNPKKIAVAPLLKTAPLTTPLVLNPKQTASARTTTLQVPNSKKIAVAPTTTPLPATLRKTGLERATTLPVPSNPKKLGQSTTRLSARTPTQAQSSLKTGAASLLGGTVGVSSQNYRGDDLAALPNSNRDRQALT
ncbi:hypothetical protein NIES4072_25110 [Nostoc commune NIES-4072]|uniref:Uncharacterized protein n=1 Tax=Nostoc commune NIES-4072 TaxID=2005467 RepID=A0A2R5FJA6_NOSCO|nr:hypothetical protein [Nostoc commune]BBD63833.1 hypothetical protein NIES4070_01750 [Nostoc commune HK-02]GBG18846.1 hypothetical protein NIES4072_25110 [Nostoc commune NIES-4072]